MALSQFEFADVQVISPFFGLKFWVLYTPSTRLQGRTLGIWWNIKFPITEKVNWDVGRTKGGCWSAVTVDGEWLHHHNIMRSTPHHRFTATTMVQSLFFVGNQLYVRTAVEQPSDTFYVENLHNGVFEICVRLQLNVNGNPGWMESMDKWEVRR
jgi:hypothetical protein